MRERLEKAVENIEMHGVSGRGPYLCELLREASTALTSSDHAALRARLLEDARFLAAQTPYLAIADRLREAAAALTPPQKTET